MIPTLYELGAAAQIAKTPEYTMIRWFYGDARAKRSQVPLMNHINEGVQILRAIAPSSDGMEQRAFCLHPILQHDANLSANVSQLARFNVSPEAVALAMEYRAVANAHLSHHTLPETGIRLSALDKVNLMLVADKVQNRKDFILYHRGKHPRSERLDAYFSEWLTALGVSNSEYRRLVATVSQ